MARPLRIEYPGGIYHITSRGDGQENIYLSDDDKYSFLSLLENTCERYTWHCHAYCLMTNHYHLLIETPLGNLSKGMQYLNGVYTQRFNRAHRRVGHVFQGRYKAILVEKDSYLLELARYIVLNPIRAGMVNDLSECRWSSYLATCGDATDPIGLTIDWLLSSFGSCRKSAVIKYKQFVLEGINKKSPWSNLKNQIYLGSEQFVNDTMSRIESDKNLLEIPKAHYTALTLPPTLKELEKQASSRDEAIYLAYKSGAYTMKEIGDYFNLHLSRISRICTHQHKEAKGKA